MNPKRRTEGPGTIELVEEAVHLLRRAPAGLLALNALGTLPFALAFLYFWAEMSRGAFAWEHAGRNALGVTLAFLWMKFWQAVFASELRARIAGQTPAPWTAKRCGQLALTQTALQPIGLFAIPVAMIVVLPFGWAYCFFQNVTALPEGSSAIADASKSASQQASLRQEQNFLVLSILSLFGFFVWVNVAAFMAMLPGLLNTFLGIGTAFVQAGGISILNTTYLASSVALTCVLIDPLIKAIYVLRCYYGQSLQTGEDLKVELARASSSSSLRAQALLIFLCFAGAVSAAPATPTVSPSELNESIDEVLKQPQFAWRMPRENSDDSSATPKSWIARMLREGATAIVDALKWVGHSIAQTVRWIWDAMRKVWPDSKPSDSGSGGSEFAWASALRLLLIVLIAAIAAFLAVLIFRMLRRRRPTPLVVANAVTARPDLRDENIGADKLPEQGWLALAHELVAKGELRLALRAFYFAGLAHLGARELISIALFKSNREYENELRRRARAYPDALDAFSQNVAEFDRAWYGLHDVTPDSLNDFQINLDRIRAC